MRQKPGEMIVAVTDRFAVSAAKTCPTGIVRISNVIPMSNRFNILSATVIRPVQRLNPD
jgi:hypothetical protein